MSWKIPNSLIYNEIKEKIEGYVLLYCLYGRTAVKAGSWLAYLTWIGKGRLTTSLVLDVAKPVHFFASLFCFHAGTSRESVMLHVLFNP